MKANIPLLECPDQTLEEVYYFRWWTFRKHWKLTPEGYVLSEFLPDVFWAGPYNTINCACCHHIREGRWLRDDAEWMKSYIRFWLYEKGETFAYSMWIASAVEDYCKLRGDKAFAIECLDALIGIYAKREELSLHSCGLFWSNDDRDGMEYSISGPGLRPTMNSYMYGDAMAISRIAALAGRNEISQIYLRKADALSKLINTLLWDGDFYRTIPCGKNDPIDPEERPVVCDAHRVREQVGYIPWYFGIAPAGREFAFAQLMDPDGFHAPWGLTTAEQRHPRFMFEHEHECLWNGPVWPFATTQTLTACARVLRQYPEDQRFTASDYYSLLTQYADSHRIQKEDGTWQRWIDEDMNPYTGDWIARSELKADHWNPERGGYERGKDYNHSAFADLVLSGLFGIHIDERNRLNADPLIPDDWSYFRVSNLWYQNALWTICFDRDGSHYGEGVGLRIIRQEE